MGVKVPSKAPKSKKLKPPPAPSKGAKGEIGFVTPILEKEAAVSVLGQEHTLAINWAKGMVGALSVFDTKENAIAWNGTEEGIIAISSHNKKGKE